MDELYKCAKNCQILPSTIFCLRYRKSDWRGCSHSPYRKKHKKETLFESFHTKILRKKLAGNVQRIYCQDFSS